MPRRAADPTIVLGRRPSGVTLTKWLYDELRSAILSGRLSRGARVAASRDLALLYGMSRRVVVNVYEQLQDEGYLASRVGVGTVVSGQVPEDFVAGSPRRKTERSRTDRTPQFYRRPVQPFRPIEPALSEFPIATWGRVAARVLRHPSTETLAGGDLAGYAPLREQIAQHLGTSRGVVCAPDQIVIVSGTQQSLDLTARLLLKENDPVWVEDPCFPGAIDAIRNAKARVVPVRVDDRGLDPSIGRRLCAQPKAVYLTPAHQFGLGATLSLERRFDLLRWARTTRVVLIEDDYDSEFRFSGKPVPAMKSLDEGDSSFLFGSFSKVLFPSLRLGYMVVPDQWMDRVLALRYQSDRFPPTHSQAILARFIEEGHFGRHLRRMRELYGARLAALERNLERYLKGAIALPEIAAGLSTPAFLLNGMSSRQASELALQEGVDVWPLDQFALKRRDLRGLLLGFAPFTEREIRAGVLALTRALSSPV